MIIILLKARPILVLYSPLPQFLYRLHHGSGPFSDAKTDSESLNLLPIRKRVDDDSSLMSYRRI